MSLEPVVDPLMLFVDLPIAFFELLKCLLDDLFIPSIPPKIPSAKSFATISCLRPLQTH